MPKSQKIFTILTFALIISCSGKINYFSHGIHLPSSSSNEIIIESNLTGIIVLWNGNLSEIPEGWALCDGGNGTPNLTNRFVMSVGEYENPGATGGSINHSHSYDDLPRHYHSVSDSRHSHEYLKKDSSVGPRAYSQATGYDRAYDYMDNSLTSGYKINFNPDPAGIENCNTNQTTAMPNYIRLSYIMKVDGLTTDLLPSQTILGWINNYDDIPEGWTLCDGTLFTPNLTERFIFATNTNAEMELTGGDPRHYHNYTDLPLHDHNVDVDSHDHEYSTTERVEDIVSGTDFDTLDDYIGGFYTTDPKLSGVTINEYGYTDCFTLNTDIVPPFFRTSFIITNESTSILPNRSIFYWGQNLESIPVHTNHYVGSSNSSIYNKFLLPTFNESLIGTIGGEETHTHRYERIPRHSHTYFESPHAHSYRRTSSTTYGVSLAAANKYVSNPTFSLTQTALSYSRISIQYEGKTICETFSASSLPPYYKLAFLQATSNIEQDQASDPIELDWYWWMIIGSVGSLAIVFTIALVIRRKNRKTESV